MEGIVERCCSNCIFFVKTKSSSFDGGCFRFPPQTVVYEKGFQTVYPSIAEADQFWCGEFKDKWQVRTQKVDP